MPYASMIAEGRAEALFHARATIEELERGMVEARTAQLGESFGGRLDRSLLAPQTCKTKRRRSEKKFFR